MSTHGRAQDALFDLLWGHEVGFEGTWQPGLLHDRLSFDEVSALIEPILDAVGPIYRQSGREIEAHGYDRLKTAHDKLLELLEEREDHEDVYQVLTEWRRWCEFRRVP